MHAPAINARTTALNLGRGPYNSGAFYDLRGPFFLKKYAVLVEMIR